MFTGLVEVLAAVESIVPQPPGVRLVIRSAAPAAEVKVGDSVSLNGCCLTVVSIDGGRLSFQAGEETLARTNLGALTAGDMVNLERSLQVGDAVGGHYVTGHVDAVGTVAARYDDGDWCTMWFCAPPEQLRQMASKGSVAVDGISLTLVDVEADRFSVALIPHTLAVTTLGRRQVGDRVNIETDVLAKYIQRQVETLVPKLLGRSIDCGIGRQP
jgi:riboflavin synthase